MIGYELSKKQQEIKEGIQSLGRYVIRPMSLEMDRLHEVPEPFMRNFMRMAKSFQGDELSAHTEGVDKPKAERDPNKPSETNVTAAVAAEEIAWADAALLLSMPGPGLGAPPIRATGTK